MTDQIKPLKDTLRQLRRLDNVAENLSDIAVGNIAMPTEGIDPKLWGLLQELSSDIRYILQEDRYRELMERMEQDYGPMLDEDDAPVPYKFPCFDRRKSA